jgi:adenylosuccinate lyase
VMRVEGLDKPYERLKELTRGRRIDADGLRAFVSGLGLKPDAERRLLELTPGRYTGVADQLVDYLP